MKNFEETSKNELRGCLVHKIRGFLPHWKGAEICPFSFIHSTPYLYLIDSVNCPPSYSWTQPIYAPMNEGLRTAMKTSLPSLFQTPEDLT